LSRPNWSRKLPRPLKIPTITTLLPPEFRERDTWRHVSRQLAEAAKGGDMDDVTVSLRLVLQLERVACLPQ
jgi:hypothetical protein